MDEIPAADNSFKTGWHASEGVERGQPEAEGRNRSAGSYLVC